MPSKFKYHVEPNATVRPRTVRGAYLFNLVDCIHACILRREHERARRAWAIFVRCPDVDWRDKWLWGLYLLTAGAPSLTEQQQQSAYSQQERGIEAERYLQRLQVSAHESEKPAILAELVLHLIKVERYRAALEQLQTYLVSYPYLLSASLHTYAGLLCFYLAQPLSLRGDDGRRSREGSTTSDTSDASADEPSEPANPSMLRQAREWLTKALAIDSTQTVAREFVKLLDDQSGKSPLSEDMDLDSVAGLSDFEQSGGDASEEEGGSGSDDRPSEDGSISDSHGEVVGELRELSVGSD